MMHSLTDEQFEELENQLIKAGLRHQALFHDLLDHYYCLTTYYMDGGASFDMAASMAYQELAPDGFNSIDQELQFLLQFNFQIRMNRILYVGAFLATTGQALYVLFRNLRWPGANLLLLMGCAALFFMVLPVWVTQFLRTSHQMSSLRQTRIVSGFFGLGLFALGSAFKLLHLPTANIQIILGISGLVLVFFPLFFWEQYKDSIRKGELLPAE